MNQFLKAFIAIIMLIPLNSFQDLTASQELTTPMYYDIEQEITSNQIKLICKIDDNRSISCSLTTDNNSSQYEACCFNKATYQIHHYDKQSAANLFNEIAKIYKQHGSNKKTVMIKDDYKKPEIAKPAAKNDPSISHLSCGF